MYTIFTYVCIICVLSPNNMFTCVYDMCYIKSDNIKQLQARPHPQNYPIRTIQSAPRIPGSYSYMMHSYVIQTIVKKHFVKVVFNVVAIARAGSLGALKPNIIHSLLHHSCCLPNWEEKRYTLHSGRGHYSSPGFHSRSRSYSRPFTRSFSRSLSSSLL